MRNLNMNLDRHERRNIAWDVATAVVVAGMLAMIVYLCRLATTWGG